jgi:tRNA(adenine34) deaminase
MDDAAWMRVALDEAANALLHRDVPIGAIAVWRGQIIGRGYNARERDLDPTAHAEIIAIRQAAAHLKAWRLDEVTLYCTLEPCAMCAGAMVLARLPRLVYATTDAKAGMAGSIADLVRHPKLNHRVEVSAGILADEASAQIKSFFASLREEGQK